MILVTGFKPFAGRGVNGSETLARMLDGCVIAGLPVVARTLDVLWGEPEKNLPRWVAECRPKILLGMGEGKGDALCFETRAANWASGTDGAGKSIPNGVLRPGDPEYFPSTMSFDPAWVADLVPAKSSDHAGEFLCNAWLFTALGLNACAAAFIHLPVQGDTSDTEYGELWMPALTGILSRNARIF